MRYPMLFCFVAAIAWSSSVQAQPIEHPVPKTVDLRPQGFQPLAPQIEAEQLLGAGTTTVPRPGDARAVSAQMPLILDPSGTSFAMSAQISPMRMHLWDRGFDRGRKWFIRQLTGVNLSIGIANVPDPGFTDGPFKLAGTGSFDIWSDRDPLRNKTLATCLAAHAAAMSGEYRMGPARSVWPAVTRERIDACLAGPAHTVSIGGGATNEFALVWGTYDLAVRSHAWTVRVDKRFEHRHGEDVLGLGARYTWTAPFFSPSIDYRFGAAPTDRHPVAGDSRMSAGVGFSFGAPAGLTLTVAGRAISPYLLHGVGDPIVRGYLAIGWGSHDVVNEMFARSLATTVGR